LFQDHESLRISLESSERIRKQQKELIHLLQKAQSAVDATAGLAMTANVDPLLAEHSSWYVARCCWLT
jgi:hypothetical protein